MIKKIYASSILIYNLKKTVVSSGADQMQTFVSGIRILVCMSSQETLINFYMLSRRKRTNNKVKNVRFWSELLCCLSGKVIDGCRLEQDYDRSMEFFAILQWAVFVLQKRCNRISSVVKVRSSSGGFISLERNVNT